VIINPIKEGTDQLQAHLEVSTLCLPQGNDSTTTKPAAIAAAPNEVAQ
jgi:hypothetical protein